jgi:hypothetical protein
LTEWHNVVVRGKREICAFEKATKFVSMEKPDAKVADQSGVERYVTEERGKYHFMTAKSQPSKRKFRKRG